MSLTAEDLEAIRAIIREEDNRANIDARYAKALERASQRVLDASDILSRFPGGAPVTLPNADVDLGQEPTT